MRASLLYYGKILNRKKARTRKVPMNEARTFIHIDRAHRFG